MVQRKRVKKTREKKERKNNWSLLMYHCKQHRVGPKKKQPVVLLAVQAQRQLDIQAKDSLGNSFPLMRARGGVGVMGVTID